MNWLSNHVTVNRLMKVFRVSDSARPYSTEDDNLVKFKEEDLKVIGDEVLSGVKGTIYLPFVEKRGDFCVFSLNPIEPTAETVILALDSEFYGKCFSIVNAKRGASSQEAQVNTSPKQETQSPMVISEENEPKTSATPRTIYNINANSVFTSDPNSFKVKPEDLLICEASLDSQSIYLPLFRQEEDEEKMLVFSLSPVEPTSGNQTLLRLSAQEYEIIRAHVSQHYLLQEEEEIEKQQATKKKKNPAKKGTTQGKQQAITSPIEQLEPEIIPEHIASTSHESKSEEKEATPSTSTVHVEEQIEEELEKEIIPEHKASTSRIPECEETEVTPSTTAITTVTVEEKIEEQESEEGWGFVKGGNAYDYSKLPAILMNIEKNISRLDRKFGRKFDDLNQKVEDLDRKIDGLDRKVMSEIELLHNEQKFEYEASCYPVVRELARKLNFEEVGIPHQRAIHVSFDEAECTNFMKTIKKLLPANVDPTLSHFSRDSLSLSLIPFSPIPFTPDVYLKVNGSDGIGATLSSPDTAWPTQPFSGVFVAECTRSLHLKCIEELIETATLSQNDVRVKFIAKVLQLERHVMAINKYYRNVDACAGAALLSRSFMKFRQQALDEMRDRFMEFYGHHFPSLSKLHAGGRFFIAHELRD